MRNARWTAFVVGVLVAAGTGAQQHTHRSAQAGNACTAPGVLAVNVEGTPARQGHAYVVALKGATEAGDSEQGPRASGAVVCEGDRALGPGHALHDDIRRLGAGRFSHWQDTLYFSTSDNTSPQANGRTYRVVWPSVQVAPAAKAAAQDWRHGEHAATLGLVPAVAATHVAVRSGDWSDKKVWRDGAVPAADARVLVMPGATVTVDAVYDRVPADWIRVDGALRFRPDVETALLARTLVVSDSGSMAVGTLEAPVRRGVHARILIAPRAGRDRRADPYDLAGGFIAIGRLTMVAEPRTSHAPLATPATRTTRLLQFGAAVGGWQVGDPLLIPGTDERYDQDETPRIAAVLDGGRTIELDRPLAHDHATPAGVGLWVGNLARPIVVQSVATEPLAARGHFMVMHAQTGTLLDGVAFIGLGRTDTRVGHTIPAVGTDGTTRPGTDDNTIGRYAVHFHVRADALRSVAPHVVRRSVVIDSPKYGIVNHGGHVIAEDNITFRVAGSHLAAENGSEIGVFRGNMAVRSSGSGDPTILSRMGIYDNAHSGNGIWLVSGGVEVTGNWASGHADSGLKMLGMRFYEQKREIRFDARNLPPDAARDADVNGRIALADVNLSVRDNLFSASGHGIEIWNHKEFTRHHERSVIAGNTVWNVAGHGIFLPYTRNTTLADNRLFGTESRERCVPCARLWQTLPHRVPALQALHSWPLLAAAIDGNRATSNIRIEGGRVEGFQIGIRTPQQGDNLVRGTALDNIIDVAVPPPSVPGRHVQLDNVAFAPSRLPGHLSVYMEKLTGPFSADVVVLFSDDRIDLTTDDRNARLFFPSQAPAVRAFRDFGPPELRAMTNAQIQERFGLALGGTLAPADAQSLARSNALSVATALEPDAAKQAAAFDTPEYWRYWLYEPHASTQAIYGAADGSDGPPAFVALREKLAGLRRAGHLTEHASPAVFLVHKSLEPLQIHPDDVQHGYRILGYVADKVDGQLRIVSHFEEFHGLKVDADGLVRVRSQIAVRTGARKDPVELVLRVTPDAPRRGPNLDWFLQKAYCGPCEADVTRRAELLLAGLDRVASAR